MKWALIVLGVLVGLAALMWLVGSLLPTGHVATRAARYHQPPERIWEALTNFEEMPKWRKDLKSVQPLPERNGMPAWIEAGSFGDVPIAVEVWEPPRRLVTRIADPKLPFGGTWTFEITPTEGGATLRVTETGEIYPAMFRFLSRFVFGYTSTIETYLKSLGGKFGEDVTPGP